VVGFVGVVFYQKERGGVRSAGGWFGVGAGAVGGGGGGGGGGKGRDRLKEKSRSG